MARKSSLPNNIQLYMLIEMCAQTPPWEAALNAINKYNYDNSKRNTIAMFATNRKGKEKFQIIQEATMLFDDFQKDFLNNNKDLSHNDFYSRWVNNGWHANSEFIRYLLLHGRPLIETKDTPIIKQKKTEADIQAALEEIFIKMEHMEEFFHLFQKYYDKAIKSRKLEEISSPLRGMVELAIREGFIQE